MEELERNLIDNILESEVKLGQACSPITFYYPESSLTELLDCSAGELPLKIAEFHIEQSVFGLEYHRFTRESYRKMMSEAGE